MSLSPIELRTENLLEWNRTTSGRYVLFALSYSVEM